MKEDLSALNERLQEQVRQLTERNDDLATLLASTDIATVVLDAELRIKRFTTPATRLLDLNTDDVERPIADIDCSLIDVDLARDARTVMETDALIEHEAIAKNARHYVVRTSPCRTKTGNGIGSVVVTMMDVTTLKTIERELRAAQEALAQRIAEQAKWLALMHEVTRSLNEASSWDERVHDVLRCICQSDEWQVGFVYLPDREDENLLAPAISHISDERFRPFHTVSEEQRYARGECLPGLVYVDQRAVWLNLVEHPAGLPLRGGVAKEVGVRSAFAVPIRSGAGVIAVMELVSDRLRAPDVVFESLMNDVSAQIGKVLDRERSAAQVADVLWREQQGLLHTLHDALGQTLTGLGMLSSGLRQRLSTSDQGDTADTARQIAHQAQLALDQVRQLTRSFFPVEIDPAGLMAALRDLASTTESFHHVRVLVAGKESHHVRDGRVANQLYRIAQEAVTNAMKHAQADTIHIDLTVTAGVTQLRVRDNGIGMHHGTTRADGLGLRIMRHRAESIGGRLSIRSVDGGGTTVTCALRETPLRSVHGARAHRSS